MPFGGFRDSGSAFKERGLDAMRFYTKNQDNRDSLPRVG